jgi:phosphoribosylformylglycinamidine cyclo-ligase
MSGLDYEKAGVSIRKGDDFAEFIKGLPSGAVSRGIGGFAGGAPLNLKGYAEPMLLTCTDGVGTKLLVAKKLGKWDTVGIDLVAMSVNDLAVCGAQPLQFLDYIACGRIRDEVLHAVIKGVVRGCEIAGCELTGGETAEMPDLYSEDDIDLAGFAVGVVDRPKALPRQDLIAEGDLILGMPSSGVHSNGYSLARKCVDPEDIPTWEELLVPTRIYVRELLALIATGKVSAAAHITGSGLSGNVDRVFPKGLRAEFSWDWPEPAIFGKIRKGGKVAEAEMRSVFNMGIGMAVVAKPADEDLLRERARAEGVELLRIGNVVRG